MGKKKSKGNKNDDFDDELEAIAQALPAGGPETNAEEAAFNVDEEGNDLGGLMSMISKSAKTKGKKGKKKGRQDDDEEDAALILAQLDQEDTITPVEAPKPTKSNKPDKKADTLREDEELEEPQIHIKSKKEKERERKERQKLEKKKKQQNQPQTQSNDGDMSPATENTANSATAGAIGDIAGDEEANAEKDGKKKKKGKKPAAKEEPAKPKRKGPPVAALKELIAAQKAAEEEARRAAEEEQRRIEEEERRLAEEEAAREEAKRLKKERERQKKEELKKSGKYLTPAQKEAQRVAQMKLQAMLGEGYKVAALEDENKATDKPKRVVYGKKKKTNQKAENVPESVSSSVTSVDTPKEKSVPVKEATPAVKEETLEEQLEREARAKVAAELNLQSLPSQADDDVKDSWDAASDGSVKDAWDDSDDDKENTPAPAEGVNKDNAKDKQDTQLQVPQKSHSESEQEDEDDSEDEDDDEDQDHDDESEDDDDSEEEDEDEELTATQKQALKRKEEAAQRRKERHDAALKARSKDDLRSPICCILGHVDTGKTKLLDKIRQTNVQEGEAGGITQQIGATYFPVEAIVEKTAELRKALIDPFEIKVPGLLIIDTPGHESFTNLRSRGSSLCNIAILVVDIMHGLEPQTLESLGLLRQRKTPFIVALNKIDRIYGWNAIPNAPVQTSLSHQPAHVIGEFHDRVNKTMVAFAEQGLNATLYYENKNFAKYVSLVPTSAITGEGVPDMLHLLVELTQTHMTESLMYLSELECTILEVKVIEGLGTTIDVVLSNGVLNEGDRIVVCGLNGPIVTNIRALLTPQPLRELRVKSAYVHHKTVKAAQGIKISAPDLEKAIAGSRVMVVGPDDDEEDLKEEVMSDLATLLSSIDKSGKGVCVQASTLGSLEALLSFLKDSSIPVSGINIGPVHKKDIIRASVMLERAPEFAQLLAFDVAIDKEASDMAEDLGVKIFKADIIYHLFDQFKAYMAEVQEQRRKDQAPQAVFPALLKIVNGAVFNKRNPIVVGVDVLEGQLRIGTPICVVGLEDKKIINLGKVTSIELNHKAKDIVRRGDPAVAIKIEVPGYETPKAYGRHFTEANELYSHISRASIDILKTTFRNDMSKDDWALIIKLKKILSID